MKLSFSEAFSRAAYKGMMLAALLLCLVSLTLDTLEYLVLGQGVPLEVLGYKLDVDIDKLDVDREASIPAWFSASVLLICSVLLAAITSARKRTGDQYVPHWGGLSIIFALLSLDESISIHELFNEPVRVLWDLGGPLHFAWVVPGGAFVVILVLAYGRFVFHLPAKSRRLVIAAGALYLSGALGLEMVGGNWTDFFGMQNWGYQVIATVEELLEMSGAILFLYTLMQYLPHLENPAGGRTSKTKYPST